MTRTGMFGPNNVRKSRFARIEHTTAPDGKSPAWCFYHQNCDGWCLIRKRESARRQMRIRRSKLTDQERDLNRIANTNFQKTKRVKIDPLVTKPALTFQEATLFYNSEVTRLNNRDRERSRRNLN